MNTDTFNFEFDAITRSDKLFSESRDEIIEEIAKRLSNCLELGRVNLWLFNDDEQCMECIGNYDHAGDTFGKGEKLHMRDVPNYYKRLKSDRILTIDDILTSEVALEIKDIYCLPNGIGAMMDIPLRMEGRLEGVMCLEHIGGPRAWRDAETQFALAISQVVALALETRKRRRTQFELVQALKDKDLLLREMHHRIKNNLSILISLLRLQSNEAENVAVERGLAEAQKRIFSMAKIHEQLYQTGNYLKVDLSVYLDELVGEYRNSVKSELPIHFATSLIEIESPTSVAINLGLITIEVLNNAVKHAFDSANHDNMVRVSLEGLGKKHRLRIADNGRGFDAEKHRGAKSIGMSIIEDLVRQIDGRLDFYSDEKGTAVEVTF